MPSIELYTRPNEHTPVQEFIVSLKDKKLQILIDDKLERLEIHGFQLDGDFFDHIDGKLWEFRLKVVKGYVRMFFFQDGTKFVFTNGVLKKAPRAPRDIAKAKLLMAEYYANTREKS